MKTYRQFCGVAKALDVLGERWTLLIARDLVLGPRRYVDLQRSLIGITTNLLAERLKMLESEGLIERVALPPPAVGQAYRLTAPGRELEPVVLALGTFGSRYLRQPLPGDTVDPRWAMVSMKRRYAGSTKSGRVQFELGAQPFALRFGGDSLDVRDGRQSPTDANLSGLVPAWFALFTRQTTLRDAAASGALAIGGSRSVLGALIKALGLRA